VRAAALRLDMLASLAPFAADVIVTGHDRREIGLMILPNRDAIAQLQTVEDAGALICDALRAEIGRRLAQRATASAGSSMRVARAIVLSEPPSIADGEITAKGNLNFRKILSRRVRLLERLYNDSDRATILA
jgi:feruloyl-CoA synthase